jgi:hypothetical protein
MKKGGRKLSLNKETVRLLSVGPEQTGQVNGGTTGWSYCPGWCECTCDSYCSNHTNTCYSCPTQCHTDTCTSCEGGCTCTC